WSAKVPTSSGSIPTAGPPAVEVPTSSDVVPTAGPIFTTATVVTPYTRRKDKKTMVESETPKKKKVQEQTDAQVARERTRIAQSSVLPPIADEPVSPIKDGSQGKACPTDSGFVANQDRTNIAKTSTLTYDSAPRVNSPAADEGNRSGDDALIKGRRLDVREEAAERLSDDTKEMATVLTSMDAATVLSGGVPKFPLA
nr:hypothetical protein [Tanacetum cinerariifolium]